MPIDPTTVRRHLARLSQQRSFDAALEFFDALGYRYADEEPLPTRTWPDSVRQVVQEHAEPPIYLATHRDFKGIYAHLTTDTLARTVERPIVEQTLHKLHPYALFLFANRDRSEWDFVNVKYVAEDGARRRTIRRIHVGPTERLHTAAQRLAMLAVPAPEASALPETGLERELGIERRLENRITEIHRTIGEDAAILHKSEKLNPEDMYAIYRGDAAILEEEAEPDIFNLLEAEELIRQLQRTDPARFEQIVSMPDGVRCARRAAGSSPGLFVFCQAGNYQRLYLLEEGERRTADPQQAIGAIRCEEDEPALALPPDINQRVAAVKRDFDAEVRAREAEIRHAPGRALGRDYALAELRLVFDAEKDGEEKARLALLSEILTTVPLTARAHRELNSLRRSKVAGKALVAQLLRIVRDFSLEEAHRAMSDQADEAPLIPRIVCSEVVVDPRRFGVRSD